MIKDSILNAHLYYGFNKNIQTAFDFLKDTSKLVSLQKGTVDIDGDNVFALVQEYITKDFNNEMWEAHKRYYDIQYIVSGTEVVAIKHIEGIRNYTEYKEIEDYWLFKGEKEDIITISDNDFLILGPQDVHQPGISKSDASQIKKIVVKVKID